MQLLHYFSKSDNKSNHHRKSNGQKSGYLQPFVEGEIQFVGYTYQDNKLQPRLTWKKRKNVEIGLDLITSVSISRMEAVHGWGGYRCGQREGHRAAYGR